MASQSTSHENQAEDTDFHPCIYEVTPQGGVS
jgi:hypothetical protein